MNYRPRLAVLLVLAAALSGFTILRGISPHDEGLMLQAGSRIASGQWPYRDFWTNYPPGQPLVLALLQDVFGPSLLAWRILRTLVDAGTALLAYLLVRRRAPEPYAITAWLAVAGAMAFPTGPGPNPPALLLALAALLLARKKPATAGLLAGLSFVFRFELGLAAVAGVLIAAPSEPPKRSRRTQPRTKAAFAAAAGALLPMAPFFIAAPGALLHDTFGFYGIQGLQRLPFPISYHGSLKPNKLLEFYIPLILLAGAAAWALAMALAMALRHRTNEREDLALLPLALVSLAYLLGRTDEFHLIPLGAVLAVMLATAAPRAPAVIKGLLIAVLALIALHGLDRKGDQLLHPPPARAVPGPAGDGVQTTPADAENLNQLAQTIDRLTRPGEAIFVANPRHDLVHAGDPLLYVILDRPNATRYDVMQPGVITTAPVQREIIRSLARTHVIVRWLDPRAAQREPDAAGRSSGVRLLDRYIATRFRAYARYGYYQVLVRRA
jgi:Dolichyl-phosphate-mannose-protein mannosyltransferase